MGALVALCVVGTGCGRYSFALRRQYDRGRYGATVSQCSNQAWAAQSWNAGHQARYHVYCGMAYLNLGDHERAATELVQAEKMRLGNPALITGRDLARLSQGLVQLFGVPAGQLEIEERPGQVVAQGPVGETPAPPVTVVPPEPIAPPSPPAVGAPSVSFTAGAGISGRASVTVQTPEPPEPPAPPAAPSVEILAPAPAAPAPAAPPVIVIPEEDGAVIQ